MPIPGTQTVTAVIAPSDPADHYPTHDSRYGRGGLMPVATIEARDLIPMSRRDAGMVVSVVADGSLYVLDDTLEVWKRLPVGQILVHQQASPLATWEIIHNLGFRPSVTVLSDDGNQVHPGVSWPDANRVLVMNELPVTGSAILR